MKKLLILIVFNFIAGAVVAQQFETPKEGAKIYLTSNEVNMALSSETKVDLWVVRSKRATKAKFDTPKFLGSAGLDIQVEADPNDKNHFIATIKNEGVANGKYFYTVASRSRSIQKVTGTTVSINVGAGNAVTKND